MLYYKRLRNACSVVDYPGEENTMPQKALPVVSDHLLHIPDREANVHTPVVVGSEMWYTWLAEEQNRSFSFRNALGTFTVRRERKRHGWYWYIYRKSGGKLRKAYLGKAEELTLERLSLGATTLVAQRERSDDIGEEPRPVGHRDAKEEGDDNSENRRADRGRAVDPPEECRRSAGPGGRHPHPDWKRHSHQKP